MGETRENELKALEECRNLVAKWELTDNTNNKELTKTRPTKTKIVIVIQTKMKVIHEIDSVIRRQIIHLKNRCK